MRKAIKVLIFAATGTLGLAMVGAGVWLYLMSNVERPAYRVAASDGAIELRDYPPLLVAEVMRGGERKAAVSAGFRPLAGYIFAKERAGDSIAMTAPVTQTRSSENTDDPWIVRFIMPAQYSLETLPRPADGDVQIKPVPAQRLAAIRFSGVATDQNIAWQEAKLRRWLEAQALPHDGTATYAYYNNPFTPGPLRRNEVLIGLGTQVKDRQ